MKRLFSSLIYFISLSIFAYPCPNGGGIMYKGDSLEEVIKECGQPDAQNTKILNSYKLEEWLYIVSHPYDPGYSQIFVDLGNDAVTKIHINEYYTLYQCRKTLISAGGSVTSQISCGNNSYDIGWTNLCGGGGFGINDTAQKVLASCGEPASRQTLKKQVQDKTELIYGADRPTTLIFENGKLVDWQ